MSCPDQSFGNEDMCIPLLSGCAEIPDSMSRSAVQLLRGQCCDRELLLDGWGTYLGGGVFGRVYQLIGQELVVKVPKTDGFLGAAEALDQLVSDVLVADALGTHPNLPALLGFAVLRNIPVSVWELRSGVPVPDLLRGTFLWSAGQWLRSAASVVEWCTSRRHCLWDCHCADWRVMHDGSLELVDCYMKPSCLHGGLAALPPKYRQGGQHRQDLLSNQPSERTIEDINVWILASLVLFSQLVVEGRSEVKSMAEAGEMPEHVVPLLSFGCHRAILKEVLAAQPMHISVEELGNFARSMAEEVWGEIMVHLVA